MEGGTRRAGAGMLEELMQRRLPEERTLQCPWAHFLPTGTSGGGG